MAVLRRNAISGACKLNRAVDTQSAGRHRPVYKSPGNARGSSGECPCMEWFRNRLDKKIVMEAVGNR